MRWTTGSTTKSRGPIVLDDAMLERLRSLNPHATRNLAGRLLEASGRGFWAADEAWWSVCATLSAVSKTIWRA